jgi:hypothetical protein
MKTFEMNNVHRDSDLCSGNVKAHSPIVEIFSAMVNGESLERFGKKADTAVNYIKDLGVRAESNDMGAIAELNTIRRFVIEAPVLEEMNLLGIFGTYEAVGFDETVEREVYNYAGEMSREQANGGDPVFPMLNKEVYPVPTFTVSGGMQSDYRRIAVGDMSRENKMLATVKTDILNNAKAKIIKKIYDAVKNATGVTYYFEGMTGLTKAGVDGVLTKVRRNGKPTIIGDYAVISQLTPWAGYDGSVNGHTINGISDDIINEIAANGVLARYNGAVVAEMTNPYNLFKLNADESNFETLLPQGLGFIIPTGVNSPIATYTRGGLTSFSGNDVKTGKVLTRFDIEVGCDIAKGREYEIGVIYDAQIGGLA